MNSKFKITIPKPCHENWNEMSLKDKGRFCNSCSKTVVDFTKKSPSEIKKYLTEKKQERVCGHFYKNQLDRIVIEIPQITFHQQLSYQKIFVLALFFVMGTTLFSCHYQNGQKQKIENVIVTDTIHEVDTKILTEKITFNENTNCNSDLKKDSSVVLTSDKKNLEIIETVGEVAIEEEDIIMGVIIQEPPRFKEAKNLSTEKVKQDFDKRINHFIQNNFDTSWTNNLGLGKGKYKIFVQFKIDEKGSVIDVNVKAPHPKIKIEVLNIMQKLPQFIPGEQAGKALETTYNLPISFTIE